MNVERPVPNTDLGEKQLKRPSRWGPVARYVVPIAAVLGALAVWSSISGQREELRAVQSIPVESRRQLYGRVLDNLKFCRSQPDERFERFCSSQAEFILAFPECDAECDELTRRSRPQPAR